MSPGTGTESLVMMSCAQCGETVAEGEQFCEACGFELSGSSTVGPDAVIPAVPGGPAITASPDVTTAPTVCTDCGGQVAGDGYCERCGAKAPRARDHWLEQPTAWVAAVCDRGMRHAGNEDAVALAATREPGGYAALVVCDGVSSSVGSDVASLAAALAARDVLARAAAPGPGSVPDQAAPDQAAPDQAAPDQAGRGHVSPATVPRRLAQALVEAGRAAQSATVAAASEQPGPNPPSCTFVAAAVEGDCLVAGWVGDSRAYWLPDTGAPEQLSSDDSWAGEAIAIGMSRAEAERGPHAHAITRWLGVGAPDPVPRTTARTLDSGGWVLVCSDGLWNYCSPAGEIAGLVAQMVAQVGHDPARVASALVAWANEQGGHDNITAALARIAPPSGAVG